MPEDGRAAGAGQADWLAKVAGAGRDRVVPDETVARGLAELRQHNGGWTDGLPRTGQEPEQAVPGARGASRTRCWQQ
jgi:hypothetical protein